MNQKQKMYIYGALLILTGIETASAEVLSLRSSDSVEVGFQAYSYEYEEKLNGSFFIREMFQIMYMRCVPYSEKKSL